MWGVFGDGGGGGATAGGGLGGGKGGDEAGVRIVDDDAVVSHSVCFGVQRVFVHTFASIWLYSDFYVVAIAHGYCAKIHGIR